MLLFRKECKNLSYLRQPRLVGSYSGYVSWKSTDWLLSKFVCIVQIRPCLHLVNWGGGGGDHSCSQCKDSFSWKISIFFSSKYTKNTVEIFRGRLLFFRPIMFYIKFCDSITLNEKNIASSSSPNKRVPTRINVH